jgi:hypothetical protein
MYSIINLEELIKSGKNLIFIHTPKCGGTYVGTILSYLKIENKGHKLIKKNEEISFTVIRNPIERFESLLNYRLCDQIPRNDFPNELRHVYEDKNISLNEIVSKMSDSQILGFTPYKTLTYWTTNVDVIITIDELPKLLELFGYTYDTTIFPKVNVSNKVRGRFNEETIDRLKTLYNDDILLYNKVTQQDLNF